MQRFELALNSVLIILENQRSFWLLIRFRNLKKMEKGMPCKTSKYLPLTKSWSSGNILRAVY